MMEWGPFRPFAGRKINGIRPSGRLAFPGASDYSILTNGRGAAVEFIQRITASSGVGKGQAVNMPAQAFIRH